MEALPTNVDCGGSCEDRVTLVPGPQGPPGADGKDGADGADGLNACCVTTADFEMPEEGQDVAIGVDENRSLAEGGIVYVENAGWMQVVARVGGCTTAVTLKNLENSATGMYSDNVPPGTTVPTGSLICPSGPQGPDGSSVTEASYILRTSHPGLTNATALAGLASGYVKSTTGTGAVSTVGEIPDSDIEYSVVNLGSGSNIDWAAGRVFKKSLTADTAITFSSLTTGKQILVVIQQNASVKYNVTWPATVKWAGGTAPVLTNSNTSSYNVFSFVYDGAAVIGTSLLNAY